MKTPEEIKKALECCGMLGCKECPYVGSEVECIKKQLHRDAYDYIQQFEADATTFYAKAIETKAKVQKDYEGFVDVIHALADQIPQWISVKERLPQDDGKYIVCQRRVAFIVRNSVIAVLHIFTQT